MSKVKSAAKPAAQMNMDKIKAALKRMLRQKEMSYKDVAALWDCSEPTVKRLLGPEELPLSRLLSLLDFLGLSLKELHVLMGMEDLDEAKWTVKQNEFLAKNPKLFAFIMKLYESGATHHSIAKKYKIPPVELERILIQLEKYDLIRVGPKGDIKPFHARVPGLDGRLASVHTDRWLDRLHRFFKTTIGESTARQLRGLERDIGRMNFIITEMSQKTHDEYREKFERLFRDMESAAKIDESLPKSELKVSVNIVGMFLNRERSRELVQLEDVFAEELMPAEAGIISP
jgi:hypothetical protein